MRRSINFTLDTENEKLSVTVFEVRPKDVLDLHKRIKLEGLPLGTYGNLLPQCCDIPIDKLLSLYPSELEEIVTKFKEVNKSFFAPWPMLKKIVEGVGLGKWLADLINESQILNTMKAAIIDDWKKLAADYSSVVIKTPGNLDGDSLPQQ